MNFPNQLTIGRLVLTVAFVAALSVDMPWAGTTALCLFVIGGLTDYIDGVIARRYNLITDFGKLMDPLADKIMVCSAFILLTARSLVPPWIVVLIVGREFLVTGLRVLAGAKGMVLSAESLGKHKTFWQIMTAVFFLSFLAGEELKALTGAAPLWFEPVQHYGGASLLAVTAVLTVASGLGYFWRNRALLETK
jgi:CDP-diacylglycerol--glycerol-3-phosphate 3-phosphatidyltransferase